VVVAALHRDAVLAAFWYTLVECQIMPNKGWIKAPLWIAVEDFIGERHEGNGDAVALSLYSKMEELFQDEAHKSELKKALSPSQYNSFRIIREWWDCSIEEDQWFRANRDREKALQLLGSYPVLEQASPLVIQMLFQIGSTIPRVSTYRLLVYRLFQMEFDPGDVEGQDPLLFRASLQAQRERAAFHASVQRLCFPFFPNLEFPPLDAKKGDKGKQLQRLNLDHLFDDVMGASIEACSWLEFKRDRSGYPFYLWDAKGKRTVAVNSLQQDPDYICISHTWGRWHNPAEPFASIENVPWLVPRNSRFNVEELPEMLEAAFPVDYIWLDLFCIPQDRSELALLEISRQAKIFATAKAVVAWLWDLKEWRGLLNIIEWLALFCIENRGDVEETLPDPPAHQHTEIVLEEVVPQDELYTPIGWFTSLWTLQEACLRPDMLLCNHDFEILTIEGDIPVTLDSLAALLNFAIGYYPHSPFETLLNRERIPQHLEAGTVAELEQLNPPGSIRRRRALEKIPRDIGSFNEIYDVFTFSGMNKLYRISPAGVFYLGQHRQCTSRRAEAIMSVVGATEWFTKHVAEHHSSPETDLVHGLYPSSFLNEAARKTGAVFYATIASNLFNLEGTVDITDGAWKPLDWSRGIGSLLPFATTPTTLLPQEQDSQDWYGHASVSSWHIESDGRVCITEAGVLATSITTRSGSSKDGGEEDSGSDIQALILIPGIFSTTLQTQINLSQWLRTFWGADAAPNYAVSVFQQTKKVQWGLILKTVGEKGVLVKIGTFLTSSVKVEDVPTRKVDWIVL
jgi:hypothetical protein